MKAELMNRQNTEFTLDLGPASPCLVVPPVWACPPSCRTGNTFRDPCLGQGDTDSVLGGLCHLGWFLFCVGHQTHSSPGSRVCYQHVILEQAQGLLGAARPQQRSGSEPSGQPCRGPSIRPAGPADCGIVDPWVLSLSHLP